MYQVIKLIPQTKENPVGENYAIRDGRFYHRILEALVDSETEADNRVTALKLAGYEAYSVKE